MTDPPRCPKCGKPPPVRRVDATMEPVRITVACSGEGCGEVYELDVRHLKHVEENGKAA